MVTIGALGLVRLLPIDPFTALKAAAVLAILALICLPWLFFTSTRLPFFLALIVVIAGFFLLPFMQAQRKANVRLALEAIYDRVAVPGPPFPAHLPDDIDLRPEGVRGYYQRDADDVFGIAFVIGSDGWVLRYPDRKWHFIGYRPLKYTADDLRPLDSQP